MKRCTGEVRMRRERTINKVRSSTRVDKSWDRIRNTRKEYMDNKGGVRMRLNGSEEVRYRYRMSTIGVQSNRATH